MEENQRNLELENKIKKGNSFNSTRIFNTKIAFIPTIDISNGRAVLVHKGKIQCEIGDPLSQAEYLSITSHFQIVDLDKARELGDNSNLIKSICGKFPCFVAGGIRNFEIASDFLNNNAKRVVISTALSKELLQKIPKNRLIVAFDIDEEFNIFKRGRNELTKENLFDKILEFSDYLSFLTVTFHYSEGSGKGTDLYKVRKIIDFLEGNKLNIRLAIAGGINSLDEIKKLIEIGTIPQFGFALWKKIFSLGEIYANLMNYEKIETFYKFNKNDQVTIFPVVIFSSTAEVLGLAYCDYNGIVESINKKICVFFSRERKKKWIKGETSGNYQQIIQIGLNCDRTALILVVKGDNNFCHFDTFSCFSLNLNNLNGLLFLEKNIKDAVGNYWENVEKNQNLSKISEDQKNGKISYTKNLVGDKKAQIAKILEESNEIYFSDPENKSNIINEVSDLLYFVVLYCVSNRINFSEVLNELTKRHYKVSKRQVSYTCIPSELKIGISLKKCCDEEILKFSDAIGLKITKPEKDSRSLIYKAYFEKSRNIKIIPVMTKPKDIYKLMQNNILDGVICFSDCMDNYPIDYVKIETNKPEIFSYNQRIQPKICILSNMEFDIQKYENNESLKLIVVSEYAYLTNLYLEKRKINAKIIPVSGSSESYLVNRLCDIAVCIVVSGKTVMDNDLKIIDTIYYSEIGLFAKKGKESLFQSLIN